MKSPLESPALGTARSDLIARCSKDVRTSKPPLPANGIPIAAAFSGGGFRATLGALGVLRFLGDAGLLDRVRYVSSVSGGSLANGLFAHHYGDLEQASFSPDAIDQTIIRPFVEKVSEDSLGRVLIANLWRSVGRQTRTDLLAETFDKWFFSGRLLEDLSPRCRFIFNAASLTTGVRFAFQADVVGDWVMGRAHTRGTGLRMAQAVAASAAVPGAFAPFEIKGIEFPCADGRRQKLVDGGAYDNSGMEALDALDAIVVALNAGGLFHTGRYGGVPIVKDLQRANSLLYRQSTALRFREAVTRFRNYEEATREGRQPPPGSQQGVLFGLASSVEAAPPEWLEGRDEERATVEQLATYKTSFDRFPREICEKLIYRGWWLTGATLSAYHRSSLPETLPRWRKLP